jgi:hypothetical protein
MANDYHTPHLKFYDLDAIQKFKAIHNPLVCLTGTRLAR